MEPDLYLDVPYVPTDEKVVEAMLDFAYVGRKDVLYDLGCGDGRIVVAAALNRSTRGVGVDMDPARIADAMEYAGDTGVEYLVDFVEGDLLTADFSEATVVTLYLLDSVNVELRPRLLSELRPGARIVSHAFNMGDWKADEQLNFSGVRLYKWIVPAAVAGSWHWQGTDGKEYRVELKQKYQQVTGKAWVEGRPAKLQSALLQGALLELVIQENDAAAADSFVMRFEDDQLVAAESSKQAAPAKRVAA
ncbi:methyltransferase [Marinobacter sp. X15-166B]|nr:methyltransferase [Marinobacter sp. X15-166B]